MEEILEIINRVQGVMGSAVLTSDGNAIAADFREGIRMDGVLSSIAQVGAACERATGSAGRGAFYRATVSGDAGRLLIYGIQGGFLAVFADRSANIGLLRLSIERAVNQAQGESAPQAA